MVSSCVWRSSSLVWMSMWLLGLWCDFTRKKILRNASANEAPKTTAEFSERQRFLWLFNLTRDGSGPFDVAHPSLKASVECVVGQTGPARHRLMTKCFFSAVRGQPRPSRSSETSCRSTCSAITDDPTHPFGLFRSIARSSQTHTMRL